MAGLNVSIAFFFLVFGVCQALKQLSKRLLSPGAYGCLARELAGSLQLCMSCLELRMLMEIGLWGGGFGPDVVLTLLFLLFTVHGASFDGASANPTISVQEFLLLESSLAATAAKLLAQGAGMAGCGDVCVRAAMAGGLEPHLEALRRELRAPDPAVLSVLLALLAVAITLLIWRFVQGRRSSRQAVLLLGLCDAGKTLLFARLLTGKYRDTQTSITDSSAVYRVSNDKSANVTLIDLPGHESLRLQFLERFKAAARAIVFVVDSVAFQREVKDVAEFLYQVLIDSTVLKNAPALLIACNKQDVTMAKSAKLIQHQLEKELNTLRVTRSAAPTSLDGSATGSPAQLGKKGKDFDFSQLPMKVEFVECSARGSKGEEGDADFEGLEKWLAKIA
ncbi:signal recognition particle receptor subunit beta isoform X1 [Athene noctua]|uniref:signal recognition particle receptor subunit beta isoform X1 n=2 Tax=Athene noctua TaxID=126797 RepID=UPI003EBDC533